MAAFYIHLFHFYALEERKLAANVLYLHPAIAGLGEFFKKCSAALLCTYQYYFNDPSLFSGGLGMPKCVQ